MVIRKINMVNEKISIDHLKKPWFDKVHFE